ncbi:hypothetical protein [Campylobacter sp. RM9328]|uniref:hypothetical protein n=1 Tax=Campylobacter sp. RM9328 TaxID=1705720 RepID=UPI001474DC2F|nr:hypothetical protein [Campylobacter sp. RM9328]
MTNNNLDGKIVTNNEAMDILGIKTKAAMSKISKKHNLSTIKDWKNVFYYESEILELKDKRENKRTSKKPNANFKERKDKIRD